MGERKGSVTFHFASFTLDPRRAALIDRSGAEVVLRPKTFDVLWHLLANAGRLVSREELLTAVWPGVFVADDNLTGCVAEIRRALHDDGRLLRTMPRRGYLLDAEVTRDGSPTAQAGSAESPPSLDRQISWEATPRPLPPLVRASLVVLPFSNLSDDPGQEYFVDGMTEELTTALSRVRWFFVIARNSAFTYKGRAVDVRQVGRELGVRYVIEGSVRRSDGHVRITVQMIETETGHHVWADRFDGTMEDIFALQDRVAEAVAAAVEPKLEAAEIGRAYTKPTENLDAYDLYLRALSRAYRFTRKDSDVAMSKLRQAVALDPNFALAKAFSAGHRVIRKAQGWSGPEEWVEGAAWARDALKLEPDDPSVLRLAALAVAYLARDYAAGIAAAERALARNSGSAQVLVSCAWVYIFACQSEKAIGLLERAMRLSPHDHEKVLMFSGTALAHLVAGDWDAAIHWADRSVRYTPSWLSGRRMLVGALMLSGRGADAREAAADLRSVVPPDQSLEDVVPPLRDQQVRDRYIAALRAAGVPG
ncbi:winged helix-turn-helix domain-containing tetratricopeptide repeat protein [Sabulicella glaciei]|uniref:Winged helix-turn-helix domain-containing tetratricopeptide repeat protein n=1 Tax=Sabulicella glaciei TaxID=2984948 RepID=A0ABT3P1J9_9PROT|nr:winged helix-turn-helix domain-containing tetratricopeptide repeat protein [Roseococcus sp. MDT2-1-1]MCW8088293.1 winged helix-turn-helix domain-containing tetratricopeptide repeat protein [Roseococcus sp. MDT2-1-1]